MTGNQKKVRSARYEYSRRPLRTFIAAAVNVFGGRHEPEGYGHPPTYIRSPSHRDTAFHPLRYGLSLCLPVPFSLPAPTSSRPHLIILLSLYLRLFRPISAFFYNKVYLSAEILVILPHKLLKRTEHIGGF